MTNSIAITNFLAANAHKISQLEARAVKINRTYGMSIVPEKFVYKPERYAHMVKLEPGFNTMEFSLECYQDLVDENEF